jgi:hypothetical protein
MCITTISKSFETLLGCSWIQNEVSMKKIKNIETKNINTNVVQKI